jgi:hypothetical protein
MGTGVIAPVDRLHRTPDFLMYSDTGWKPPKRSGATGSSQSNNENADH